MEECEFITVQYEYDGDKLLSFGTEACEYDDIGNPKKYREKNVTWSNGRQMTSYDGTAFTYDGLGRRLSKGNITYTYDGNNRIIKQSNGIEFIYDNSGVAGIIYSNGTYLYRKDGQGNICALIDNTGNVVVEYKYDAWGNHAVLDANGADINDASHIGNLNPFRYRGYYYDTETGLYYLKSRYYDPETGRFITIDDISYLDPETINGLNLYAYCGNNPVMRIDENGNAWWDVLLSALAIVAVVASVIAVTVVTGGAGSLLGVAFLGGVISAGSNALGQVIFEGKNLTSLNWAAIGINFAVGFVSSLIPGSGFTSILGRSVVSALTENGLNALTGQEEFSFGELFKDIGIGIFAEYLTKGVSKGMNKLFGKIFNKGSNYSTWQAYLRKKGFNYSRTEVYGIIDKALKWIERFTSIGGYSFSFIFDALRSWI